MKKRMYKTEIVLWSEGEPCPGIEDALFRTARLHKANLSYFVPNYVPNHEKDRDWTSDDEKFFGKKKSR